MSVLARSRWTSIICIVLFNLFVVVGTPLALDHNDRIDQQVLTLAKLHQQIVQDAPRPRISPAELSRHILSVSTDYHLDPFLLLGLVKTESSYNPGAESEVGALGLTQMMPAIIRHYGMTIPHFQSCHRCQIELAAKHLTSLLKRFDGRYDLALLSYHGSLKPSQSRYVLRIYRAARQTSHLTGKKA